MSSTSLKSIQTALDLVDSKKENLRKLFEELQSHSSLLSSFAFTWDDIESSVNSTQSDLLQKFSTLQDQESLKIRKPKPVKPYEPIPARPELKSLCENMDALGLRKYIIDRPKERTAIRVELVDALKHASDPGSLILDALDGYCGAGPYSGTGSEHAALGRACAVLLEEFMRAGIEIGAEVKKRAAVMAAEWRGEMVSVSDENAGDEDEEKEEEVGALDKLAYLQLLAAYKLVNDGGYDVNELIDYVVTIARSRQAVELCQTIGLESQVSDIVQKLIEKGKQLLALKFIFEFELIDEFPPMPLLEAYVLNSEKLAQKVRKSGKGSRQSLNEAATKEINALKAVIKCIEDRNLESQYPKSVLVNSIKKLEKEKGDRKRTVPAATSKPQQHLKRPPPNGNKRMRAATGRKISAKRFVTPSQPSSVQRSGLLPEYTAPYQGTSAGAYGMAGTIAVAAAAAAVPSGSYPTEPHAQQPHVQPGYYDGAVGYVGNAQQPHVQPGYYDGVVSYGGNAQQPHVQPGYYDGAASYGGNAQQPHVQPGYYDGAVGYGGNAQQPHVQPGYYDGAVGYGGYSIPPQYQPVYYQQ